ncbi:cytochrome b/b6 domain-containing protein [Mesorhizobium australicum]|uniref:cytochrome b/b6 domain-containing protein n=1 Tax=Mesorhizobium australicum TaxID=536018 RepID=UPI000A1CE708
MTQRQEEEHVAATSDDRGPLRGALVYRQSAWTRLTHWLWAISLFFLLLTGLQIFNAHPTLYIGDQSGFSFDNAVLSMRAENTPDGPAGYTTIFGHRFDTTGVFGLSEWNGQLYQRGFPEWATIPSYGDLATGRVIHFFFAWLLVGTLLVWLIASLANGHFRRDIVPNGRDMRNLGRDIADHIRLRFHHMRDYSVLQKLAYASVLVIMLPLMILTGLGMSPGMNAALPWLPELLGGRQTARTIHFAVMVLLVGFFVVHILMILAAGPLNEMRSIVTGWYRTGPAPGHSEGEE